MTDALAELRVEEQEEEEEDHHLFERPQGKRRP
jgi:hypothetical protein